MPESQTPAIPAAQMIDVPDPTLMNIPLTLTGGEINLVLEALLELPMKRSMNLVSKIKNQGDAAVAAFQLQKQSAILRAAPAPEQPAAEPQPPAEAPAVPPAEAAAA